MPRELSPSGVGVTGCMMKVITWNLNSIRARHDRLLALLERHQPDLLCLQEIKVQPNDFPFLEIQAAGYHAAVHGQKTYNGVAILSRTELTDVVRGMQDFDDAQARLVAAKTLNMHIVCAYFPNGGEVGSDKYAYKLEWMKHLAAHLSSHFRADQPLVLCGDFNVAPDDGDVAFPEQWNDTVLCVPPIREALKAIRAWGLCDTLRPHHPEGGVYSWWDYRQLGFPKNNGLRIDFIDATQPLAERCTNAWVDRNERKGKQPSDHAPVVAEFDWPPSK